MNKYDYIPTDVDVGRLKTDIPWSNIQTLTKYKIAPIFFDIEVINGVFLIVFKFLHGAYRSYVISENPVYIKNQHLEIKNFVKWAMENGFILVGYNNKHYDNIILTYVLKASTPTYAKIKELNDDIIADRLTTAVKYYKYDVHKFFKYIDMVWTGNLAKPAIRSLKLALSA
jgi:hypothetical protein